MNDRVMQFRLGMFVIVAGLVLTMMIVWFGESPSLLRDQYYILARYSEAPGVLVGVTVRKSGIRIGEVVEIAFDNRPNQPDGVLVTLAIERRYLLREGSVPRLTRSLIGDVTIDMLPGTGTGYIPAARTPASATVIEGEVAADPSKALAAATTAFEQAGDTLKSINEAATGLARISQNAEQLDTFLATWTDTGKNVAAAAEGIDRFLKTNEAEFRNAVATIQEVAEKIDKTLDPETQDALKTGIAKFSAASSRLETSLADASPLFQDLGAPVAHVPTTDFGQSIRRLNRIASDLELLSSVLRNRGGGLNDAGTLQKLLTQGDLYENLNTMATSANQALVQFRSVLASLRGFAEKVSRDPSAISRGILQR
jgi:phospholipid/cholesterol/gamma-HCH transport system substrate-binding protein